MAAMLVAVLALLALAAHADDIADDLDVCDPSKVVALPLALPIPTMSDYYTAGILVNSPNDNSSYELILGTDLVHAYIVRTSPGEQIIMLGDYPRKQLITMAQVPGDTTPAVCMVESLDKASKDSTWVFGYDDKTTPEPHPRDPGWVFRYKEFDEVYTGKETVLGIPCNRWEACKAINMRGSDKKQQVGVKFYWSDPEVWTPVVGQHLGKTLSVPVMVELTHRLNGNIVTEVNNVFRYFDRPPPEEAFQIPQGVFCPRLSSEEVKLPTIPQYFSYESEIVSNVGSATETLVFYQKHYFDDKLKISRVEESPIMLGKVPSDDTETGGLFVEIHDFGQGLQYVIDQNTGQCFVGPIGNDTDVKWVTKSKVRMQNPLAYLHMEGINYTYYEQKMERNIPGIVFMGVGMGEGDEKDLVYAYEYYFSGKNDEIEGSDLWTSMKPIKFSKYPVAIPDDKLRTFHINMFNFDVSEPDILGFDISACSPSDQRRHLEFELDGRLELEMIKNMTGFKRLIVAELAEYMQVVPLRIHDLQFDETQFSTIVRFTLLAKQNQTGDAVAGAGFPDIPSAEAVGNLRQHIDSEFIVLIPEGGVNTYLTAIKESLREIDEVACRKGKFASDFPNQKAMPKLPAIYDVSLLVNVAQNKSSYEVSFGTDGKTAYVKVITEGIEVFLIGDYDRQQLIEMTDNLGDKEPRFCTTKSLKDAANSSQWIFGYNTTGEGGRPHIDTAGWVFHFKDFEERYVGKEVVLGVPCHKWEACKDVDVGDGTKRTVGVKFYWSNPDEWTASTAVNKSVPVKVEVSQYIDGTLKVEESIITHFASMAPPDNMLQIPPKVFCSGLSSENIEVPEMPKYFSYESEIILNRGLKTLVFYQKHFYDEQINITRLEYTELATNLPTGSGNDTGGQYRKIHDFNAGVAYVINPDGQCTVSLISDGDDDVEDVTQGKARMRNPMELLNLKNIKYTYYGKRIDRSIPANLYMGLGVIDKTDYVYEYYFENWLDEVEGTGKWSTRKPLEFSLYPLVDPDDEFYSSHTNIFNFDIDRPEIMQYDITACTPEKEKRLLEFVLNGAVNKRLVPNDVAFKRDILILLAEVMMVSPLRIHNIEYDSTADDMNTIIVFTLLKKQDICAGKPNYNDLTSDAAIKLLKEKIDYGNFEVALPGAPEGIISLPAIAGSLKTLNSPIAVSCDNFEPPAGGLNPKMPSLGKVFSLGIQVTDTVQQMTYDMILGTDGEKNFMRKVYDGIVVTLIGDYNRQQVIAMTGKIDDKRPEFCMTESLKDAAEKEHWIFGYNTTGEHGRAHPNDASFIFNFEDFTSTFFAGSETIMGIPCLVWLACQDDDSEGVKLDVEVKWYWSDPNRWTSALGHKLDNSTYSVPVRLVVSTNLDSGKLIDEYNIVSYSPEGPTQEQLEIPQGVYCLGLKGEDVPRPNVPDYFSYDSEIITKKGFEELVFYQKHYFDDKLQLTRMDYSPLKDSKVPMGNESVNSNGEMSEIHDFNAGLMYLTTKGTGICVVGKIVEGEEDVQSVDNHKVRMRNPMSYLKLTDVDYTYYQSKHIRDMPASQFMGLQKKKGIIYEYWFSAPWDQIQGEGEWTTQKPLKFAMYPQVDPDNSQFSIHINMFNFDDDEPDILAYDISGCTPADEQRFITFQLPVPYEDLFTSSIVAFKRSILQTLVQTMAVSPLRIHNIELVEHEKTTTVLFTLLKMQTAKGDAAPSYYQSKNEVSSEKAIQMLKEAVDNGKLVIKVPKGDLDTVTVDKDSTEVLDERPTTTPTSRSGSSSSSGYSGGSMAGIAIGMILLGLLLGGGGTYLYVFGLKRRI